MNILPPVPKILKAFNSVPHGRLINKLSALGINEKFCLWIKSFLFERSEIVVVEGVKSDAYAMTSGVPQDSCIVPLLLVALVHFCFKYM